MTRKWREHHRHEVSNTPTNLDPQQIVLPVSNIQVYSWYRQLDAKGDPEQVHMVIESPASPPHVVRFKSREAVDAIITALKNHRDDVWGNAE